ncbi:FtsK/SpoIIIE family protein putative EssC component of Type VII secretion system [Lactococcus cremoris]|uniref:FtsK/SpoIIIE family protein putative EssC component of Type VII secretion system n=1 Tax=Lactococcus lactis subsp. cremoris TaxID=1359 RepID=A0A161W0L4_LACLC|nr:type VII secretion protein EssC [Lactococcus cremoris]KZK05610.1 FtsK/SpoIIIE family protein putative EssC component of Type VII secretion system [Lactococcus cremoris]
MKELFELENSQKENQNFLYEVRHPEDILYVIFILKDQLERVTLTKSQMTVTYENLMFGIVNDHVLVNGGRVSKGKNEVEGLAFIVFAAQDLHTHFLLLDNQELIIHNQNEHRAIQTLDDSLVIIENEDEKHPRALIKPLGDFVYYNNEKLTNSLSREVNIGDSILTPDLMVERRSEQWKVTSFARDIIFNPEFFLEQHRKLEKPQDFPEYRRSPRLNLEIPEEKFKYEKIEDKEQAPKGGLVKAILPPVGMLAAGSITTLMSGRNPLMMMATALASLMTVTFTVTQYRTEKKDRLERESHREEDYQVYLAKTTSKIGQANRQENEIIHYQQPSPQELLKMIEKYDSRLYERMVNNKDFLQVSLGTGTQPSGLKVETDYTSRDEDEWATHVKKLVEKYSQQEDVPIALDLRSQTLGLIGNYDVLKDTISNLYLQMAFFQSYRDLNFITLVPEKSYAKDWQQWRFLPHFKVQGINTRGIVHNAKSRDIVLSSFYQIINSRKQELNAAGREKPTFLPHFVFTILDDSYLAGHGLNEFLAEDMSDLGVTVIWAKEDKKLLPETITALVEVKNQQAGVLIQDNGLHLDKVYKPYPQLESKENFEVVLRQMSSLEHMEVEKNAIPERLSLLEQYLVETVEDLNISERWAQAEPNKSIASMIGWKGKKEFAFWDLHEQVHGPHAIVGGTSGSGKSEFLTTFLMGLAINFSPEDIGMLIIDWKGGGIADTLADLPHFMGSITNLDGAGTARALASINAELKKRQREFREYGVSNIAGYTKLYRERNNPREGVNYPHKPLPHLMLVSDEFAELKENVPEFLDELTSVARIGRSLGVHLILATQKPDGVVNDQIDANAKSKVALKMSDEANSKALIKTGDAAHITNAGRGYLRVGESEVYELFQSGYGGVDYNPHATTEEIKDERIYRVNESGQWELLYDPREDLIDQGAVKEDVPTQLEATIAEIVKNFEHSSYTKPDKPWLPNLGEAIVTKEPEAKKKRNLSIPLGLLDIPSMQSQEVYNYNLEETSHTVIFSSPGFGKSVTLQTMVMNLARQNTPEQVQFNLFDFGTNGLLPLKNLPHVADIVTLEENEKLQKMFNRLEQNLAERKALFKKEGVANLNQYQAKAKRELPILVNVLDSYDGLSQNDNRKDNIDNLLMKVLREGAAVGIYLVITAGRYNAIRMNMMANIQTKMALFLNEDGDLSNLFGRDKLEQVELPGRAQIKLDQLLALQIYLPVKGESEVEVLAALEQEITAMNDSWTGSLPDEIPMVPDELTPEAYAANINKEKDLMPLGLNKLSAQAEFFKLFNAKSLGIFPASAKQFKQVMPFLMEQLFESIENAEVILIDASKNMEQYASKASVYISKESIVEQNMNLQKAIQAWLSEESDTPRLLIMNGLADLVTQLNLQQGQLISLLTQNNPNKQLIVTDYFTRVGNSFNMPTTVVRENAYQILFGGDLNNQHLIENLPAEAKKEIFNKNVLHAVKDEEFFNVVIPVESEEG